MIQPAFYRNDFAFIKHCLAEFVRMATGQFIDVAILIDQIIAYYELTDRIGELESQPGEDLRDAVRVLEDIESKLKNLRGKKDKIYNIFDVLLEDFLGAELRRLVHEPLVQHGRTLTRPGARPVRPARR